MDESIQELTAGLRAIRNNQGETSLDPVVSITQPPSEQSPARGRFGEKVSRDDRI